ncbi:MAG: BrnT family toxin [Candidatus Acidiferrales bacterium]
MFSWDATKALRNYEKHGVSFEEASTVFSDSGALDWEVWSIPTRSNAG